MCVFTIGQVCVYLQQNCHFNTQDMHIISCLSKACLSHTHSHSCNAFTHKFPLHAHTLTGEKHACHTHSLIPVTHLHTLSCTNTNVISCLCKCHTLTVIHVTHLHTKSHYIHIHPRHFLPVPHIQSTSLALSQILFISQRLCQRLLLIPPSKSRGLHLG